MAFRTGLKTRPYTVVALLGVLLSPVGVRAGLQTRPDKRTGLFGRTDPWP